MYASTHPGNFIGSAVANNALGLGVGYQALYVEGDVDANVTLAGTIANNIFVGGSVVSGATISIGGSLPSGSLVQIGAITSPACLVGQIIINANNNSSIWSSSATVEVGVQQRVDDAQPRSILYQYDRQRGWWSGRRGSLNFRAVDCVPAHNSSTGIGSFPSSAVIRHYGPVYWSGTGSPVTIYARPVGGSTYTNYTSDFSVTAVTGNNHRDVQIVQKSTATLGWAAGYEYKITPNTNTSTSDALRCLDVTGKPAVVAYEYKFTIIP